MDKTLKFIEKSNIIHNNKYDYSKSVYVKISQKLEIICPLHGSFFVTPGNHTSRKSGCPSCSMDKQKNTIQQNNQNIFVDICKTIHKNYYDYSKVEYINAHSKIQIICPIHGNFQMTAYTHKQGGNCPKCAKIIASSKLCLTTYDFIKRATEKHTANYDYSYTNYITSSIKVQIGCPTHGPFFQRPSQHLQGQGCPTCGSETWWKEQGGYSNSYFTKNPTEKLSSAILYIVMFSNSTEQFYKIGITKQTIKQRYHWGYTDYDMKIIYTHHTTLFQAYNTEQQVLSLYKRNQYIPTIKIGGWTECLDATINIQDIITHIS